MKVLSLWQPWASCIAQGLKRYETRSWTTSIRGELFIHAAKGGLKGADRAAMEKDKWWRRVLERLGVVSIEDLPRGCVLCRVDLVNVLPAETVELGESPEDRLEWFLGGFDPGRFAWHMEKVLRIAPVPVRGAQGLFCPSPEEIRAINLAMGYFV